MTVDGAGFSGSVPVGESVRSAPQVAPQSVGYSGVTVDGAGFSGSIPVGESATAARSSVVGAPSGYDDVLSSPIEPSDLSREGFIPLSREGFIPVAHGEPSAAKPYDGIKIPPPDVLARLIQIGDVREAVRIGRTGAEPYANPGLSGYSYLRKELIGRGGETAAKAGMLELQSSPNNFFPFNVLSPDGLPGTISRGNRLILTNRYPTLVLPPGERPGLRSWK